MSIAATGGLPQRTRWGIIALLMGFPLLGHFNRLAISVVGSERLIRSEGLSEEQMGLVYTTFLLVYTLSMLPGGWFIDRVGAASALRWMGVGFGLCAMLTGVLGWAGLSLTALWAGLLVIRAIAGISSAPLHPGAARGVALWAAPQSRATANGLVTSAALVGVSITYPGFGWLMDSFDWPAALVISGAALFGYGLLWQTLAPSESHAVTRREQYSATTSGAEVAAHDARGSQMRHLLGNRSLLLLTASYTALGYLQYVFFYWVSYYFESVLKRSTVDSRWASFVITMAMAVGMALGGRFSDAVCLQCGARWGRRFVAFVGMGLCALFAWLGVRTSDPTEVTVFFSLSLASLGMCEGIFWTTATDIGGRRGGMTAAILNTGGNAMGAFAPTITPWLAKQFGWETAIGVACAICALGGALWLGIAPATSVAKAE
jgi:MFS family permease